MWRTNFAPAGLRGRVIFGKGNMMDNNELGTNLAEVGTDCISRQQAIDAIGEKSDEIYKTKQKGATYPHDDFFQGMAYAENVVKQLPPIQPEIVRCKDCKHWIPYDWMFSEFSEMWLSKNIADYPEDEIGCDCSDMAMKANDFCSRGERREVNNESN